MKSSIATFVLSLLIASLTNAQSVVGVHDLALSKSSNTSAISMKMVEYDDGSIKIHGEGTYSALGEPIEFQYSVNTDTREVTVNSVLSPVYDTVFNLDQVASMSGDMSKIDEFEKMVRGGGTSRASEEGGWYWTSLRLRTKDFPGWTLAQSWIRIDWYVQGPQSITFAALSKDFWANPDTPLHTEWFIESTGVTGATIYAGRKEARATLHGEYYNWDWAWDHLISTSDHDAYLQVSSLTPILVYNWDHVAGGEHALVIFGYIAFNYPTSSHQ